MRVFLSGAAGQRELAERIAEQLEAERHEVCLGITAAANGAPLVEVRRALRRAHVMVFLISPRSVAADAEARVELEIVEREWGSAQQRLVPVMAEETPAADVPGILRRLEVIRLGAAPSYDRELVDALADASHDAGSATTLARRAGISGKYLPEFKTAVEFWERVVADARRGSVEPKALLDEALKQFPYNEELRALARLLGGGARQVGGIAAGQNVVSRVSYAVDLLARRKRRRSSMWIGATVTGMVMAGVGAWWSWPDPPVRDVRDARVEAAPVGADVPVAETDTKDATKVEAKVDATAEPVKADPVEPKPKEPEAAKADLEDSTKVEAKVDATAEPVKADPMEPEPKEPEDAKVDEKTVTVAAKEAETPSTTTRPPVSGKVRTPGSDTKDDTRVWSSSPWVVRIDEKTTMRMVKLEGDTFTMGSPKSETGHSNDETQHEATVSNF